MLSTHKLLKSRLANETGNPTLITTITFVMFALAWTAFVLVPLIYTPQIRDDAVKSIDSWTLVYGEYGTDAIPPYSSEYRPNVPDEQNTVTYRLREELGGYRPAIPGNRYVTSVKEVMCGKATLVNGRLRLVQGDAHTLGTAVACGADLNMTATKWRTPGFLDAIFGDFWHISQPTPVKAAR